MPKYKYPIARFFQKIRFTDTCWIWTGSHGQRYGQIRIDGRHFQSHRFAYELLVGPIPKGKELHHKCEVKHCVNPAHLQPVTRIEHMKITDIDGGAYHRTKMHCPKGHPYDEENTYYEKKGRSCRECHRQATREWRKNKVGTRE
jgi:hypothetical protein